MRPRLVLLACAALAITPAHAAATRIEDEAAVRAVGQQWRALYEAGDYAAIPELYTEDTMVMPRNRPRISGRDEMRRSIGGLAAGRRVSIEVHERELVVAGDLAWYVGDFEVTYSPADGARPVTREHGRSLVIFRRDDDGSWRIHRDMDSPAPQQTVTAYTVPAALVPPVWDPQSRTEAVACDRVAASRYDRHRLAPPVARADIDVPAAIAQCEADLKALPGDARVHFNLGRLYGYTEDKQQSLFHRRAAAAAGEPNAIFLLAYLDLNAAKDQDARCDAARRMKLAADRGNYSGQLTYTAYLMQGRFTDCGDTARPQEIEAYLAAARPVVDGFFETLLAEHLMSEARGGTSP